MHPYFLIDYAKCVGHCRQKTDNNIKNKFNLDANQSTSSLVNRQTISQHPECIVTQMLYFQKFGLNHSQQQPWLSELATNGMMNSASNLNRPKVGQCDKKNIWINLQKRG